MVEERAPLVAGAEEDSPAVKLVGGEDVEAVGVAGGEEEDTGAQVAPIVELDEVPLVTGEEEEEVVLELKAKLFRFVEEQWKERGTGVVKLLRQLQSEKVRLLMRQSRTKKVCANHYLSSCTQLKEHSGNDKSWLWHAMDFSDGELKKELLCMRFASLDDARSFKETFEVAKTTQDELKETEKEHTDEQDEEQRTETDTVDVLAKLIIA